MELVAWCWKWISVGQIIVVLYPLQYYVNDHMYLKIDPWKTNKYISNLHIVPFCGVSAMQLSRARKILELCKNVELSATERLPKTEVLRPVIESKGGWVPLVDVKTDANVTVPPLHWGFFTPKGGEWFLDISIGDLAYNIQWISSVCGKWQSCSDRASWCFWILASYHRDSWGVKTWKGSWMGLQFKVGQYTVAHSILYKDV